MIHHGLELTLSPDGDVSFHFAEKESSIVHRDIKPANSTPGAPSPPCPYAG